MGQSEDSHDSGHFLVVVDDGDNAGVEGGLADATSRVALGHVCQSQDSVVEVTTCNAIGQAEGTGVSLRVEVQEGLNPYEL